MDSTKILNKLIEKKDLTPEEINFFLSNLIEGKISSVQGGSILTALRMKGETVDEITELIKGIRKNMIRVYTDQAVDVCGTGGDQFGSFNVSTATAFVTAGAGTKVVKHGGRAISSQSGSADVMEKLGINISLTPQRAELIFYKVGMVFLFAPMFHPALKNIATIRKELKIRTIFNLLGPFANPASVERQMVGVPNLDIAKKLAKVGRKLSYERLLIITSVDGMDEVSLHSKTIVFEINKKSLKRLIIDPQEFGFKTINKKQIMSGTIDDSAQIIKNILNGKKGPHRDVVVFNSAFALYTAGAVRNIKDGIILAENSIDSGKAKKVLENLIKETKKYE